MESEENKRAGLSRKIYRQSVYAVSDFTKKQEVVGAKFMVIQDDSYSAMGADYGPPDPPPTMETHKTLRCIMLHDEAEVEQWVRQEEERSTYSKKPYKIFKVDPVTINTSISVSIG